MPGAVFSISPSGPAVIVLVERGISFSWPAPPFCPGSTAFWPGLWSRETLEEAVEREVLEEVGIRIQESVILEANPGLFPTPS
jgi:NADH pyrophosphatase NudC (nudix superfamily)